MNRRTWSIIAGGLVAGSAGLSALIWVALMREIDQALCQIPEVLVAGRP